MNIKCVYLTLSVSNVEGSRDFGVFSAEMEMSKVWLRIRVALSAIHERRDYASVTAGYVRIMQ